MVGLFGERSVEPATAGRAAPGQAPYGQPQNPYGVQPNPPQPYQPQQPYQPPYASMQLGQRDPDRRPGTVTAAGVVAIILSSLSLLAAVLLIGVGAVGSDSFTDGFRDGSGGSYDGFTDDEINNVMLGIGVVLAVWCAAAVVLAILVLRRSNVARILLVISSAVTVVVSLIGIVSGVSAVTLIGAIAVIVLLFVGGANDWYARRGGPVPAGPPQPWG